jgi:polyisoprenoid-binding protein YceI
VKLKSLPALLVTAIPLLAQDSAQDRKIDTDRSTITIHVGKAGLLSAAGHEHWVNAPLSSGVINSSTAPRVEFTVETAKMRIKPDPKIDAKTEAQIQKDMEEMTLDTAHFHEIKFQSSQIQRASETEWHVDGTLSLHGVTKPVSVSVTRVGEAYTGRTILKQSDFGIKPVSVAGGTIKIKNEIEISFMIFAR